MSGEWRVGQRLADSESWALAVPQHEIVDDLHDARDTIRDSAAARLIVCEHSGRWAVALRRELAEAGVRVWETRTLADCRKELAASPASFVVLELSGEPSAVLRFMARQPREFPGGPAGRGGRRFAGRPRAADARGGGRPFPLLAPAGRTLGPVGLPPPGPSPAAVAELQRADLEQSAVGRAMRPRSHAPRGNASRGRSASLGQNAAPRTSRRQ